MLPCVTMEGLGKHLTFNQYHSFLLPFFAASPATETVHNQKVAMPILAFHLVLYNTIAVPANIPKFSSLSLEHSPGAVLAC